MEREITMRMYPVDFDHADSNFNSLACLKNGTIYYTLCSHDVNTAGRIYRLLPGSDKPEFVCDLGEVIDGVIEKRIPQGKSHTPFFEYKGKIYVATHCSYYGGGEAEGKENPAPPPAGYKGYSGGRFLSLDPVTNETCVLASAPEGEGIITMGMDTVNGICYGLTWPSGLLLVYNVNRNTLKNCGKVAFDGEIGKGERYSCLCRIFANDPKTGRAYFTRSDGALFSVDASGEVVCEEWCNLKREAFGYFDPTKGGHQGYNWRYLTYSEKYGCYFGIHGKSGWLFAFDPSEHRFEVIDRIPSDYCRRTGCFEDFRYGYMALTVDPRDPDTICYISGYREPGADHPYLTPITYSLKDHRITDHGYLKLEGIGFPENIQTLAVTAEGRWFCCPWYPSGKVNEAGKPVNFCQLASFTL